MVSLSSIHNSIVSRLILVPEGSKLVFIMAKLRKHAGNYWEEHSFAGKAAGCHRHAYFCVFAFLL